MLAACGRDQVRTMGGVDDVRVRLTESELAAAETVAVARLQDDQRRHSPDRRTARNPVSQRRGAVGEIAATKFLRANGFEVEPGFESDNPAESDLAVSGHRVEVMTAQVAHRQKTGFCVPPNKLWAARQRGAVGYLFVGTGPEERPQDVVVQGAVRLENVDADPPRETWVSSPRSSAINHVVRDEDICSPHEFVELLRQL